MFNLDPIKIPQNHTLESINDILSLDLDIKKENILLKEREK